MRNLALSNGAQAYLIKPHSSGDELDITIQKALENVAPLQEFLLNLFLHCHPLLPRYYQDKTNQSHLVPLLNYPDFVVLWVLGCLRLDSGQFLNRRSLGLSHPLRQNLVPRQNHLYRTGASLIFLGAGGGGA